MRVRVCGSECVKVRVCGSGGGRGDDVCGGSGAPGV